MRRAFHVAGALGLGLVLNGCIGGDFGMPFRRPSTRRGRWPRTGSSPLENTNGSVRLAAGTRRVCGSRPSSAPGASAPSTS